jgi:hypothetical protein
MNYIALVYHEREILESIDPDELQSLVGQCASWVGELEQRGDHVYSSGLQCPTNAMSIRERNGRVTTTDGPFAETKEFLGGFTVFKARDLNDAIQIASRLPAARIGTVEVRPVLDPFIEMCDSIDQKIAVAIRGAAHDVEPVRAGQNE